MGEAADVLIRGRVHTFDSTRTIASSIALRGRDVLAVGDDLDALCNSATRVIDEPRLVILPGFYDTHVHQLEGSQDVDTVQLRDVASITDLTERVRRAAEQTPAGSWIITSRTWHETAVEEKRLVNLSELDAITTAHPVCVRRGSHLVVGNTPAFRAAGLEPSEDGCLAGDEAIAPMVSVLPEPTLEERVAALGRMQAVYNARGIVAIRDPGIGSDDLLVYQRLWEQGKMTVRSVVMIRLDEGWPAERMLEEIDRWGVSTGFGDEMLRLGGVKFFADGRSSDAAISGQFAHDPSVEGCLFVSADMLETVGGHAVSRGWEIGTHAIGDVAMENVVEGYARILESNPGLRPGSLVIEHAMLALPEVRRRAIELGIGISVHPTLQYEFGAEWLRVLGKERCELGFPVREWIEEGALIAGGSDGNVPPWDPLLAIRVLETRCTRMAGIVGAAHAVDRETAFELYTVAGARLLGESGWRGALEPGHRADLMAFSTDPFACAAEELPELEVAFTLGDGRPVHDPAGRFA